MKAFVIKNKEGKYLKRGFNRFENPEKGGAFNTGHFYFENKEEAESDILCYGLEDCKVVLVTVAEGDLEYQNELLKQKVFNLQKLLNLMDGENIKTEDLHWADLYLLKHRANEQLKEQLKEKDKELEELKFEKRNLSGLIEKVSSKGQQEIRKQVCDELREKLPYYKYSFQELEVPRVDVIEIRDIDFILDQIEQGE